MSAINISVIIPNYNQTHLISGAIQSALNQTYPVLEVIIVDDGSSDRSQAVVAKFGGQVQYIRQENQGLAGARNTGIRAAKGEWIGFLDADDEWLPNYLEHMLELLEKYPSASVFYCMAQCMDVDGHDLPQVVGGPPIPPDLLYHQLLRANFIIPSTVTCRRKSILDMGCFDANLRSCEDWDLWLRILPGGKIIGSSKNLVRYRVHGSSLSTNLDGMHGAMKKVVEKNFGMPDGDPSSWSPEKRRIYGGFYRYQCITFIQRQNNWDASLPMMQRAFQIDPSLALDLDFFYELALGVQPVGYRGLSKLNDFDGNAARLQKLVSGAVVHMDDAIRKQTLGTAYYALSLVAYTLSTRSQYRKYFRQAVLYRPELILNLQLIIMFLKSFVSKDKAENLKKIVGRHS